MKYRPMRDRCLAVGFAVTIGLCGCYRPTILPGFPTTIGTEPVVVRLPTTTPNVGPQFRVYLQLSNDYKIEQGSRANPCAIYGPNNTIVHVAAAWIALDGTRHRIERPGCTVGRESQELEFFSSVIRPAQPRAAAIALSSDAKIAIVRARWWSGDPTSLCLMCL